MVLRCNTKRELVPREGKMKFKDKLLEGTLLSRYKRFFADVEYNGEKFTIHVPNTGSLKSVIEKSPEKPQKIWFSLHGDETKKLKGTLEAVQTPTGVWVGVNTANPNRIVTEAIQKKPFLPHWKSYNYYKPEFKISKETRLDGAFFSTEEDYIDYKENKKSKVKAHFIEIKNTTYVSEEKKAIAQFPDAVTERGQKHLTEMMELMKLGHQCEIIYTVQRSDTKTFSPCAQHDPKYAQLFYRAMDAGLKVTPLIVYMDRTQIYLTSEKLNVI